MSKVSRLLAEARRQGIVTIHVAASRVGESPFERELAERLGLQAVYVAPARVADASVASRAAALMAARMLPRLLPMQGLIGFSGGYTVAQLAHALEPMPGVDLTIVPLQGNWVEGGLHVHNDQVCRDAAHSLQARALSLPAPMVVRSGRYARRAVARPQHPTGHLALVGAGRGRRRRGAGAVGGGRWTICR